MKRRTKKLVLSCTALLAFASMAFGLVSISNVTVKAESPVTLLPAASIRLAQDENDANGIRFESTVTKAYYEANANAVYGTLICPADYLSETNVLCHDDNENGDLYLYDAENDNATTGNKWGVLDLRALPEYVEADELYLFKGSLTNVKDQNLARPIAARSYVGIPDGNGGYEYTYSDVYSRSIYSVATHAVAYTEVYDAYTPAQQSFLDNLIDKVADSVKDFTVSTDKTGAKISTEDEVKVTASVTVDTKHYDGELEVAPMFTTTVDGEESKTALNRVGANVYTLADLGEYTLTPYLGKTEKWTADDLSLTCNFLSIFTKAGDITVNESGKLVNKYISGGTYATPSGTLSSLPNAELTSIDGYDNVLCATMTPGKNENNISTIILTEEALKQVAVGSWLVFDICVDNIGGAASQAQLVWQTAEYTDRYFGGRYVFTMEHSKAYVYGIDENGNTVDATEDNTQQIYDSWGRIAIQFLSDVERYNFFLRTDLFNTADPTSQHKVYIKNMYLTTDAAPYSVEASGFDTNKKYSTGETIDLTATAYKDGKVVEGATSVFSVEGTASLKGNVLTVGAGEIKITVTNSTISANYPVSRTYTIQAETWSDLAVTGIEASKTYAYNEIVTLGATAVREGESEAQAVNATYEVVSGSAAVWQDSQGKWLAKPGVGESEIAVSYGDEELTVIFKGDTDTVMLLGGATEQGYESDALLTNYFKNTNGPTSYSYELYNGRYAVNYNKHVNEGDNFELKTDYNSLLDINGWLYVDMYLEDGKPGIVYFTVNGNDYYYMFSSYNSANVPNDSNKEAMQRTEWQWYDMDGQPYTQQFNSNHYGRWVTLEMKLTDASDASKMAQLRLEKYPGYMGNMYISSVVVSKTRLVEAKQAENAQVLNILDDEQAFENYWTPAGTNSEFTWTNIEGRNAVKYKSLQADCSALFLDAVYKTSGYDLLLTRFNYVYIDFFVEEDKAWNSLTVLLDFGGKAPTYMCGYANTAAYNAGRSAASGQEVNLGFDYQWYVTNSDGQLEALTSAPTSQKGVWVTLEICIPYTQEGAYALTGYDIRIEKYPNAANVDNDLYISNARLSKTSLTGVVAQ